MFIGHFAVAFAAKPAAPRASLGTLFLACGWIDLVWPLFLLMGIERVVIRPGVTAFTPLEFVHYPWTHSLVMCLAWAAGFGVLYYLLRAEARAALVVSAVVLSHWFLDLLVHRPVAFYARRTRAIDRIGRWGFYLLVVFLLLAYLGAAFGPPPPGIEAIAWAGLIGGAMVVALGYWVDHHRTMAA